MRLLSWLTRQWAPKLALSFILGTAALAPFHAALAGSDCGIYIVSGEQQTAVIGGEMVLPLVVRYDSDGGIGPPTADVTFFVQTDGALALIDPVDPANGSNLVTFTNVPDGGQVAVRVFVPSQPTPDELEIEVYDDPQSGCSVQALFRFPVVNFNLVPVSLPPFVWIEDSGEIQVQVIQDSLPVDGYPFTFRLDSAPPGTSITPLFPNAVTTDTNGIATATLFTGAQPGRAFIDALPHNPFLFGSGPSNALALSVAIRQRTVAVDAGDQQSAAAGAILPAPLVVRVSDQEDSVPFPAATTVTFRIDNDYTGGAVFVDGMGNSLGSGPQTVGTVGGLADIRLRLGSIPNEEVHVCARDADDQDEACFDAFSLGIDYEIGIISGDGQSGLIGNPLAQPLVVEVTANGVPEPGATVEWSVLPGSPGTVFTQNGLDFFATTTDGAGRSEVGVEFGSLPGPVTVRAELLVMMQSVGFVDFSLQALDLPPSTVGEIILVSGDGQVAPPGTVFEQPLVVQLLLDGEPAEGVPVRWQRISGIGLIEPEGSGQVDRVSDGDGFSSVLARAPGRPGPTQIRAAADGFGAVVFDLSAEDDESTPGPGPGQPVRLVLVSGGGQSGAAGASAEAPIVVRLETLESDPKPVPDARIDWSVVTGAATLSAASSLTNADGLAQIGFTYGTPGAIQIRAQLASDPDVRVEAGAESFQPVLRTVSGDGQSAPVSSPLPLPLTVAIGPPGGMAKGLAGVVVNWTVVEGGGSLAQDSTPTASDGSASNLLTLGPNPGPNRIRAEIAGAPPVFFTASGFRDFGAGAQLVIISGNNQTLPTNLLSEPLVVELRDGSGNPIPDVSLRWTPGAAGSQVEVESEFTTTAGNGRSSNRARVLRPGRNVVRVAVAADNVTLQADFVINAGIINTSGLRDSERDFAGLLDDLCADLFALSNPTAEQADLIQICRGLVDSSGPRPGDVRSAIRQIMPEEILSSGRMGLQMGAAQFDNLKARLAALRGGVSGISFGGLALRGDNGTLPLGFLDTLLFGAAPEDEIGGDFSRWAFFVSGTFGRGEKRVTEREAGFKFDNWSLTAGVDYRYSDSLVLGAAAGYNRNDTRLRGASGSLDSRGYSASLYSTWYKENFYLDGVLTLGRNDFELLRDVQFTLTGPTGTTAYSQTARSKTDGDQFALALSAGRDFSHQGFTFGPYLRATLARQKLDGFTETVSNPGAPGSSLVFRVDDRTLRSRSAVLGGKVNYAMSTSWGVLLPHFQLEYQREFEDDEQDIVVRFLHDPGSRPLVLRGDPVDRSFLNLGLGVSAVFASGRSAFIFYERTSGLANQKRENLALGLRIEF
jgi:uncharacterized protein YhjY with autotransporter beta-barrel domain